ncbi:hypothetical protein Cylst_6126 [Cylindrospermum stagnale PCC 7417]|uniref:Uncharacterized protein n=1 Tax=Cylindrospermum stagnale PCC 7417 TaxID=56107 RepID=K9X7L9_9NOST|nr:hypothetical protein [Cylindrospermum stagnale]AFZ28094.1 hypothetical protein Cylst_6126 [Cylindrospermum stagnale PCC 7417]
MDIFYHLLQEIRKRPTLYLSRQSIFDFQSFYFGYNFSRRQIGIPETDEELEFEEFLQWVRKLYSVDTNQSWASIILFHSIDERDALDRLFNIFEDFLEEKNSLKNNSE